MVYEEYMRNPEASASVLQVSVWFLLKCENFMTEDSNIVLKQNL